MAIHRLLLLCLLIPCLAHASLLAQWEFEENTGTTSADRSGNGHTATFTNAVFSTSAKYGAAALLCDGTGDTVSPSGTFALDSRSFSIIAWVFPDTSPISEQIFFSVGSSGTTQNMIILQINSTGSLTFAYWLNDLVTTTGLITFGAWNHLAFTYASGSDTSTVYVNGVAQTPGSQGPLLATNVPARLCDISCCITKPFKGRIDNLRVYDHTLGQGEIDAHRAHRPRYR